jgi:demethylmenaquinone methyltransferase/2-methoxy-6-polyprenyl-1,4-benzoquinol methylase
MHDGVVTPSSDEEARSRNRQIQAMFGRIVPRYDRMNRLMSFGMDTGWRRLAAQAAEPSGKRILDLGTGTGDLARELVRRGAASVCGVDLTPGMLDAASRVRPGPGPHSWLAADGHHLPFAGESFDALTNAFLLRNLVDLPAALREMSRVVRPGGPVVCLDMTQPPPGLFSAAYRFYWNTIMPPIAGLLSGDRHAYRYLPNSLLGFPDAEALSVMLRDAGFRDVTFRRLGGGSVALHTAVR